LDFFFFVIAQKKKKKEKKALISHHIIGNFRILRFWRICFHKKIPLCDESVTLDFVLSPKNKKKALISRHIIREFQNSKILAQFFPQKNSFI
jgi:hypothetical protein